MRWFSVPSDPVITDLLSEDTLDNASFVNPSQNHTIELRCDVCMMMLLGRPHWIFFSGDQSQQFVINSTSDRFVIEENTTYVVVRGKAASSPASLEGLYCCVASDGPGIEDSIAKCVEVTTRPLKSEWSASCNVYPLCATL